MTQDCQTGAIRAFVAAYPLSRRRTRWTHGTIGDLTSDVLDRIGNPALAEEAQVVRFMDLVSNCDVMDARSHLGQAVRIGTDPVEVAPRTITIDGTKHVHSPAVAGLWATGRLPQDEAALDGLLERIRDAVEAAGGRRDDVLGVMPCRHEPDFGAETVEVVRPETRDDEPYRVHLTVRHLPTGEGEVAVAEVAARIAERRRERRANAAMLAKAVTDAYTAVAGVEGMRAVGARLETPAQRHHRTVNVRFEVIGNTLAPTVRAVSHPINDATLKAVIGEHRANQRRAAGRPADEARTCCPVLAAAMIAMAPKFGTRLLEEVEAVLAGRAIQPRNPVKRGISNLSMRRGELSAPVALKSGSKGVRMINGRVAIRSMTQAPASLLTGLPGRRMRDVVDHPYLEGLTVLSTTVNTAGLQLRPKPAPVALGPLLERIRGLAVTTPAQPARKDRA